jgi:glucosamine kinase
MTDRPGAPLLAVDVGKTTCRVRIDGADLAGPGSVGLAEPDGNHAVLRAVAGVLGPERSHQVSHAQACIATAGHVPGSPAESTAQGFVQRFDLASCAVTSDAIASHVGALGGAPGVVLAAGTGSIAIGVSAVGEIHVVDGVGQWLGDEGSGAWIGLEGLRAAARAHDGRGPDSLLRAAAEEAYGDLDRLAVTLQASSNVPRAAARFATTVCRLADRDEGASSIITRAAQALADTAIAAAHRTGHHEVALVGGLQGLGPILLDPWHRHLAEAGISVVPALGSALDGAATLALRRDLPHEPAVTRVDRLPTALLH